MEDIFFRTSLLIGEANIEKLNKKCVWVFGIGGVGGYCAEALVRSGVGHVVVVDKDTVDITNINRQIIATVDTVGHKKVDVFKERALKINPNVKITALYKTFTPENEQEFDFSGADYIVDAVDMVSAKLALVEKAQRENVPVISSMGTGNKTSALGFEVTDIYKTSVDPLAKVMRRELRKRGIKKLKVVYSKDEPKKQEVLGENGRPITASVPWVPPVAGFILAGEVAGDLLGLN